MSVDTTLTCRDCGTTFVFTSGEQDFYASRGFDSPPGRCSPCRAQRKADREAGGGYSDYRSAPRGPREMFTATCATCGQEARVPFQPTGEKPVYCSSCFEQRRGGSTYTTRGRY
jgi:CxxC-x17-CxxC domain-containing protein